MAFKDIIDGVFKWEAGYQNNPEDKGNFYEGELVGTNLGISARTLAEHLGRTPTSEDMKNLTKEEAKKIYKTNYYDRYKIDQLPEDLKEVAMHSVVMSGNKGIKDIQQLIGVEDDGSIGPDTLKALEKQKISSTELKNAILGRYEGYDNWDEFGKGWTNRYNDVVPTQSPQGVNSYEQYMQAAENENAALMPNFGAPKVAAAPAVSPNFNVAGGYNPNKVAGGLPAALPQDVVNQGKKVGSPYEPQMPVAENTTFGAPKPREEVITEKETVTEKGPGFYDRFTSGIKELLPFKKGGAVNFEEYMQAMENTNKDLIPISLPNWYTNPNDIDLSKSGTSTLPPEQRITPNRDEIILKPGNKSNAPNPFNNPNKIREDSARRDPMQEAARRSMMQGNEEERMADYNYARAAAQVNPESYALPQMQAAQRIMGGYAEGGTVNSPQGLASLGRGGDSTLVHMQPREVAGLQQLAQANGTSLTRNPMTGYPEAFSLGGMFKAALPIAAGYFTGGAGYGLGSSIAAGAATGAGVAAATGDDPILGAVTGGMGGYSGMGLESALMGTGAAVPTAGVDSTINPALVSSSAPITSTASAGSIGSFNPALDSTLTTAAGGGAPLTPGNALDPNINRGAGFLDRVATNLQVPELTGTNLYDSSGGQFMKATGGVTPAGPMKVAKALGSPIASMGLGGLEESDFMVKPDFNDPRDKYDPRSTLNLNRDTGINEAMSRDTGLRLLAKGGYLKGPGDGMSDDIPATINGDEPAALADGEFVIPADVVSHLGNGSSAAGSKQLHAMMERIRQARTGRKSQGKEIKPGKYMPR